MPKLNNVTPMLKTADMQRTVAFYRDVLGFTVETLHPPDDPTICFLDHGDVHLSFYVDAEDREPSPVLSGQIHIDTSDLPAYFESIKDKVKTEWGPEVYFYGRREFAIKDPDGYLLAFSEPTDESPDDAED